MWKARPKGSVLIIVLWAIFILSALALAISGYARARISMSGRLSQNARDYYLARAGAERAMIEIKNAPARDYDSLNDSWANEESFKDVPFGDGTYSVAGFSDEERKINVNTTPLNVLQAVFEIAGGAGGDEAKAIAASIVNWRNPADRAVKEGAGEFYYQTLDPPYKSKNAPIEVLDELLLVKGVSGKMFDRAKPYLTIYGNGAVNINTTEETVLRSLGMSEELAKKIIRFREGGTAKGAGAVNVFNDMANITAVLSKKEQLSGEEEGVISSLIAKNLLSVSSDNFSAVAVGKVGGKAGTASGATIAFVFDRKNNAIRYWRE